MTTLQDVIGLADVAVDEGDTLTIDRSSFASRKRGRVSTSTKASDEREVVKEGLVDEDSITDAKFWEEKYMLLRQEKSKNEEDLEAELELGAEREKKLGICIFS